MEAGTHSSASAAGGGAVDTDVIDWPQNLRVRVQQWHWAWRALYKLPAVFVFLCYTVTVWPITRYLLPSFSRSPLLSLRLVPPLYLLSLLLTLALWLRLSLLNAPGRLSSSWLRSVSAGRVSRRLITFCARCDCPRPLRAHHCSQCGQCALQFDHHCPWTACCVGHRNKKFFLQYLCATTAFTGFCAWLTVYKHLVFGPYTMGHAMRHCWADTLEGGTFFSCLNAWVYDMQYHNTLLQELSVLMVFVLSAAFTLGCIVLLGYHISIALKNYTTLEDGMIPNPFDLGSRLENLRQITGPSIILGMLDPRFTSIGDGYEFPMRDPKKNN